MGLFKYEEKLYDECSKLLLKAIELDPECKHFEEVYGKLADCYFMKPETSHNGKREVQEKTYKVIFERFKKESKNISSKLLDLLGP